MIKVNFHNPQKYKINTALIEQIAGEVLLGHGKATAVLTIAFVSNSEMKKLVDRYYPGRKRENRIRKNEAKTKIHSILSFPASETSKPFIYPPGQNFLGEIVISPQNAKVKKHNITDLVKHGCLHLVGVHHP